jgi:hexokinase
MAVLIFPNPFHIIRFYPGASEMTMPKEKALRFLADNGLAAAAIDTEAVLENFLKQMTDGLAGRKSSLAMIPTFITLDKPVPANSRVIVLDAGGTNLRVATVVFDDRGVPTIDNFSHHEMPGSQREVGKDEFFNLFVEYLLPVAGLAGSVGFCFSYAAEITPDRDGKLMTWTKEIKAPEVIGEAIGKNIVERLKARGLDREFTLLNDTVAALLAGKSVGGSRQYGSYIGFILGTGTNTSYVEKNVNIAKRDDLDPKGAQAINVESGNFAGAPQGPLDLGFDRTTANPGAYTFEKMISGAYLGGLCLHVLKAAADQGLFSSQGGRKISPLEELSTIQVDAFLRNPFAGKSHPLDPLPEGDKELILRLFAGIIERAALLAAINISAAVLKSGGAKSLLHPVCVNAEGSTFYKTKDFRFRVEEHLRKILGPRDISYELIRVDDSPLIGAAVAGLTR